MRTMKDSGLSWVGEIPSDWVAHPVYYYFGERKNKNIFGQEDNLLSLSYGRVIRKDINTNGGLLPESFNTYNIVEAGDIIIRPIRSPKRQEKPAYWLVPGKRYHYFCIYCFASD